MFYITVKKPAWKYHLTQRMEMYIALILGGTQYAKLTVIVDTRQRKNMRRPTNTTKSQESGHQEETIFPGPTACNVSKT